MKKFYFIIALGLLCSSCQNTAQQTPQKDPALSLENASLKGDELIQSPYGTLELQHNYLTDESAETLMDALDFQRASQAYIWSTPLVSFYTWIEQQNKNYQTDNNYVIFKVF